MAENSGIEWTTHTFNPWRGCVKVSPACANCYAERGAHRNPKVLGVWGEKGTRVCAAGAQWALPSRWQRDAEHDGVTPRVFCASLADVFEDWGGQMTDSQERPLWHYPESLVGAPRENFPSDAESGGYIVPYTLDDARARLWELIQATPDLRWLLLTKRPENIGRMMPHGKWPNVWLGTTVESQAYANRIDALAEAPQEVPVRFISCEPLLGPLSLWSSLPALQWVIVGGESGSESREMRLGWVRSLVAQCRDSAVPIFVKQMGRVATEGPGIYEAAPAVLYQGGRWRLALSHDAGHGGDMQDWPEDLRIREVPPA